MDNISNVTVSHDCEESFYVRPARMSYVQDGKKKTWDLIKIHDSVGIVLFNTTRQVLVFVKQFRPAVYYTNVSFEDCEGSIDTKKYPVSSGMTFELCAGIVDKGKSLAETVQEEVLEECGYNVPLSAIQKVTSYRSGVGVTGSLQTLFYAEVTDTMKTRSGGGNADEGEYIDIVELKLVEAQALIYDESVPRPASLLLALMWFFQKQQPIKLMQKL